MDYPKDEESDRTAAELVEEYMLEFGKFSIETKFANCIDGLKNIHRRIIFILGITETKLRVLQLSGKVMELHFHGDSAIAESIVKLSQPFNNICPLVMPLGSVGNFGGELAAKPRYLDVVSAPFTRDVYFKNTNIQALTLVRTDKNFEPKYFIPKLPMALLTGSLGIVPGFKSDVVAIGFKEVCELAIQFIKVRGATLRYREHYKHLSKYLIPDHPAYSLLKNQQALTKAYTNKIYNHRIIADGILHITPGSITIRSLPFVGTMMSDETKIHLARKTKGNWYDKYIQELCGGPDGELWGDIQFKLKRGIDPFVILEEFKKHINFTRSWTPINTWLNKDGLMEENFSAFDILEAWYDERFKYIRVELKHTQTKLIVEYRKLEALIIVVDHALEVHTLFHSSNSPEEAVEPLCKRFGLTAFQAKYLFGQTNAQITKQGKTELTKKKQEVRSKISNLQKQFTTINQRMLYEVIEIQKKYSNTVERKLALPDFIGYVNVGPVGIVQYSNDKEMLTLIKTFGSDKVKIHRYPMGKYHKYLVKDHNLIEEEDVVFSKQLSGKCIYALKNKPSNVVCYKKNSSFRLVGTCMIGLLPEDNLTFVPVGNKCITISKRGVVSLVKTSSFVVRKNLGHVGDPDDLIYVDPLNHDKVLVVHGNRKEKNQLRLDLLDLNNPSKLSKLPIGKTHIVAISRVQDILYMSVPDDVTHRVSVRHLIITDIDKLFDGKSSIKLNLKSRKTTNGKRFKRYMKSKTVFIY